MVKKVFTVTWIPNFISATPLHMQLVMSIHRNLVKAGLCEGDSLPPVQSLSHQYGVSTSVIVAAYEELVSRKLVEHCRSSKHYRVMKISCKAVF
jgi:DNA-binding transcriptional regulator YhcF (GntR family)